MGDASEDDTYTLLGINAEGAIPAMELAACRDAEEALARARAWLNAHPGCVRVQVWREPETLVGEIAR